MESLDGRTINQRITHYRKLMNISIATMADRLGLKEQTYETRERYGVITCQFLIDVASILEISPSVFLLGEKPSDNVKERIPVETLAGREDDIVKMYRNLSNRQKNEFYEYICNTFFNRRKKKLIVTSDCESGKMIKNFNSMDVNKRIAKYRKLLGFKQSDIAKKLGVASSTYAQKEREGNISCKDLMDISKILRVNPIILLFGEDYSDENLDEINSAELIPTCEEEDIIKMYRSVSKDKKSLIYAFIHEVFSDR